MIVPSSACVCVCAKEVFARIIFGVRLFVDHKNEVRVTHLRIRNAILRIPLQEAQQIMRFMDDRLRWISKFSTMVNSWNAWKSVYAEYVWSRSQEKNIHTLDWMPARIWAAFMHKRMSECDANVPLSMDAHTHFLHFFVAATAAEAAPAGKHHLRLTDTFQRCRSYRMLYKSFGFHFPHI